MKLSKLTLEWLIYHAQHSDAAGYTELKIIEEINEALSDNTLEIEGYEKSEWVKFDPDDPKTIPPKNTVVLLAIQGLPLEDNICTWHTYLQERHNARGLPGAFTHWRPIPPTPGKE